MMEAHSIQEYISLLEKLEKLYTFRTPNNVSVGWIPNFTYKPHFIYRGHGDYRYTILPGTEYILQILFSYTISCI